MVSVDLSVEVEGFDELNYISEVELLTPLEHSPLVVIAAKLRAGLKFIVSNKGSPSVSTGNVGFSKLLSLDFTLSGEELLSLPPVIGLIILKVHSPLHLNEEIGVVDVLAGHVVEHVGALVDGHVDISRLDLLDIGHDAPVYVHLFVVEIERVLGLQPEVPFLLVVPSPLLHVALVAIVQVEVRLVVHLGFLVPARVAISCRQLQEREAGEAGEALIQVSEH